MICSDPVRIPFKIYDKKQSRNCHKIGYTFPRRPTGPELFKQDFQGYNPIRSQIFNAWKGFISMNIIVYVSDPQTAFYRHCQLDNTTQSNTNC